MKIRLGLVAVASLMSGGLALAQPPPTVIDIRLGQAVADRSGDIGRSELEDQARYLRADIQRAVSRISNPPARIDLVIADIEPNRPTSNQLGLSSQLRENSFGVGGAAVTGEVVLADGTRLPVRYRFFQSELRDDLNFTTWGDADQAFDNVSALIGAGHIPNDPNSWPRPHLARAPTGTRIPG